MGGPPTDKLELAGRVCRFEAVQHSGDPEVMRIAKLQHGCVHRQQFLAAGISRKALARRVAQGRVQRLRSDVFLAWPCSSPLHQQAMAVALQLRGDAAIAGVAAAGIWRMLEQAVGEIEVTLVGRNAEPAPGIRIRRVATLASKDIRRRAGIPLTSPARTLIDLAATLDPLELENALAEASFHGLVRDSELAAAIARAPQRAGTAALSELLAHRSATGVDPSRTRSLYERRLLKLIEDAALPRPVTNVPVEGQVVDMFWPAQRLVVEFDGFAYHRSRQVFETDRLRDQRLVAAGYRVIRITARQLDHTPYAVIARLAQALSAGE